MVSDGLALWIGFQGSCSCCTLAVTDGVHALFTLVHVCFFSVCKDVPSMMSAV